VVPPPEYRWKPGQSGNPKGRTTAGATIREWVNSIALDDLTESHVRAIARNREAPWTMRAAALRILRTLEQPDMADFAAVLKGEKTLDELRKAGINTEMVKSASIGTQGIRIELHDRSGEDFDRVVEKTDGKDTQRQEFVGAMPVSVQIVTPLTRPTDAPSNDR
jgi:tRNA U55 pseudouridine synthase TruB